MIQPRFIRLRDASTYCGMDRNRFNSEVRPYLLEIPIGKQGIAFDRLDLDRWLDLYKSRNGRPGRAMKGGSSWGAKSRQDSLNDAVSGTSRRQSQVSRVRESCQTGDLADAERYLAHRIGQIRNAALFGVRPKRTFREAATRYLNEYEKKSLAKDAWNLKRIDPFIGDLYLENVHMGTLRPYIEYGKKQGWKNRTINMPLEVARHVLNLASGEWIDEHGLTWLQSAPKIRLLPRTDAREPYPISWDEQTKLFAALPEHLRMMCFFAVNTGLRNKEICGLRWDDEVEIPALETSVFILPKERVKNREDRLVVINRVARAVLERVHGDHPVWVFTYKGSPVTSMYNTAWKERERQWACHS